MRYRIGPGIKGGTRQLTVVVPQMLARKLDIPEFIMKRRLV